MTKKKLTFALRVTIEDLIHVPLLTGVLFVKWRFGKKAHGYTKRCALVEHRVVWREEVELECTLVLHVERNVLLNSVMGFSVRQETEGGQAFRRLGAVEVNVAACCDGKERSRRYLLHQSAINAALGLRLKATFVSGGAPTFRLPTSPIKWVPMLPLAEGEPEADVLASVEDATALEAELAYEDEHGVVTAMSSQARLDVLNPSATSMQSGPAAMSGGAVVSHDRGALRAIHQLQLPACVTDTRVPADQVLSEVLESVLWQDQSSDGGGGGGGGGGDYDGYVSPQRRSRGFRGRRQPLSSHASVGFQGYQPPAQSDTSVDSSRSHHSGYG